MSEPTASEPWAQSTVSEVPALSVRIDHDDAGTPVVRVVGELDITTSDDLRGALEGLLGGGPPPEVAFDLSEVTFLDSSGLAAMIGVARAGSAVTLCAPCTRCNPDRFYSYRASGPSAGRQLSWIGWQA